MKLLILASLLFSLQSAFAQNCSSLRECQLRNEILNNRVKALESERNLLSNELSLCLASSATPGSSPVNELQLELHGKTFTGAISGPCSSNFCGDVKVQFNFFNNNLRTQLSLKTFARGLVIQTTDVRVPDQYGEYVDLTHPGLTARSGYVCRYIVQRGQNGEVSSLNFVEELVSSLSSSSPCPGNLTVSK